MTIADLLSKAVLLPLIAGIIEALKMAGMPVKFAPITSILIGGAVGVSVGLIQGGQVNILIDAVTGLGLGSAATGLYGLIGAVGTLLPAVVNVAVPPPVVTVTPVVPPDSTGPTG